jgi:ketosteroid isomerase-like protein
LEIVRRWLAAFNREDVDVFVELWDPECEFFTLFASQLAGAPYTGHEGLRRYCEERAQVWDGLRIEMNELREGGERIVAIGRPSGRGRRERRRGRARARAGLRAPRRAGVPGPLFLRPRRSARRRSLAGGATTL